MSLPPRLREITKNVIDGLPLADIGTDHAIIPIELIKEDRVPNVIATDIGRGPLDRAARAVLEKGLSDQIELRLGPGIETIKEDEVDQVVIAGMGGRMISEILENDLSKSHRFRRFILQPMTGVDELRRFLFENGFRIDKDIIVKEGKHFYSILIVSTGESGSYDSFDLEYGYSTTR